MIKAELHVGSDPFEQPWIVRVDGRTYRTRCIWEQLPNGSDHFEFRWLDVVPKRDRPVVETMLATFMAERLGPSVRLLDVSEAPDRN